MLFSSLPRQTIKSTGHSTSSVSTADEPQACIMVIHNLTLKTRPALGTKNEKYELDVSMRMVRVREKVFRNSSGFRFNVNFVDCTSVFFKAVLEPSLQLIPLG